MYLTSLLKNSWNPTLPIFKQTRFINRVRLYITLIPQNFVDEFVNTLSFYNFKELGHPQTGARCFSPIQVAYTLQLQNVNIRIFEPFLIG